MGTACLRQGACNHHSSSPPTSVALTAQASPQRFNHTYCAPHRTRKGVSLPGMGDASPPQRRRIFRPSAFASGGQRARVALAQRMGQTRAVPRVKNIAMKWSATVSNVGKQGTSNQERRPSILDQLRQPRCQEQPPFASSVGVEALDLSEPKCIVGDVVALDWKGGTCTHLAVRPEGVEACTSSG